MKKNSKGFTLVELLAVIVVLAVIMVIATTQVNATIKKSRANSFFESVQSIRKSMQTVCATDNKITQATLNAAVNAPEVTITISGSTGDPTGTVEVVATTGGKFTNRDDTTITYDTSVFTLDSANDKWSFPTECPIG